MTLGYWIETAMHAAVLAAFVAALIAALIVPFHRHGHRSTEHGHIDPHNDRKVTPSL